jgi:hypothetical protein
LATMTRRRCRICPIINRILKKMAPV